MRLWRLISPFEETENRVVWWVFGVTWLFTAPWVVAGMVLALKDGRTIVAVLLVPLMATLVTTIVFYGSIRFRDSVIPLLVVLAGRAMVELASTLRDGTLTRADDPRGLMSAKN